MRKILAITPGFILLNSKRGVILLNRFKQYMTTTLVDDEGNVLVDHLGRTLVGGIPTTAEFLVDSHARVLVDHQGRALFNA